MHKHMTLLIGRINRSQGKMRSQNAYAHNRKGETHTILIMPQAPSNTVLSHDHPSITILARA